MLFPSDTFFLLLLVPLALAVALVIFLGTKKNRSDRTHPLRLPTPFAWMRKNKAKADSTCQIIDKRQHARINLEDTTVNVSDGCIFCTALVENVSTVGICLSKLPEPLYKTAEALTIFSSSNDKMPTIRIEPRWVKKRQQGKTLGATIVDVSEEWTSFLGSSVRPYSSKIM